jgi:1,4-dihydroxy-6-naphthoate synthase
MITVGHTPDADDAFMFYYLTNVSQNNEIKLVLKDIESLNGLVISNAIDCSAVSFYTYFKCADNYELLDVGACFGENYGPVVVKKANPTITFSQEVVAVPGENTTAYLLLKLFNPQLATLPTLLIKYLTWC